MPTQKRKRAPAPLPDKPAPRKNSSPSIRSPRTNFPAMSSCVSNHQQVGIRPRTRPGICLPAVAAELAPQAPHRRRRVACAAMGAEATLGVEPTEAGTGAMNKKEPVRDWWRRWRPRPTPGQHCFGGAT
ncbi:unnamed protein product [Urochloa humidicola]